jgi:hypothetical protein
MTDRKHPSRREVVFHTTRWHLISPAEVQLLDRAAANPGDEALEALCRTWLSILAYLLCRLRKQEGAENLAQEFWCSELVQWS